MDTNLAKAHHSDSVSRGKLGVVVPMKPPIASAFAPVTITNAITTISDAVSEVKTADVNADATAATESWTTSTSPYTSLPYNNSNNQTNRPLVLVADISPITRTAHFTAYPTPSADPLTTIRHHRPISCNNQAQERDQDQDRETHLQVRICAPQDEPRFLSPPAAPAVPVHADTIFAVATDLGFLGSTRGSTTVQQLTPIATTTTTGNPASSTFAFMQDPADQDTDMGMNIVFPASTRRGTPGETGMRSSAAAVGSAGQSESEREGAGAGMLTAAPASSITIVVYEKTLTAGVDGDGLLVSWPLSATSTTVTKKQVGIDFKSLTTPMSFFTVTQAQDEILSTSTWCGDGAGACHEQGSSLTPTSLAPEIAFSLIKACRVRSWCSFLTLMMTDKKSTTEMPTSIPTIPATPVLTTIDEPVLTTSTGVAAASDTGDGGNGTNLDPDPSAALSQSEGDGGWNAAKVIAPTVIVCVLIAAAVLWWFFKREKQIKIKKRMEERAEWMKPEFGEMMRERMMQLDDSKTGKLNGVSEEERKGCFGGRAEWGKKSLSSSSVIERELLGSGTAAAGRPLSSATKTSSRVGDVSTRSSREGLTAVPPVKVDVRDEDTGGGFGWKVFKGRREIRSYQAGKVGDGEGAAQGGWRKQCCGWYTK